MIMQISNSSAQQSQEILGKILEGKNPDIQSFLINGMSDLLNRAFTSERQLYLSENNIDCGYGARAWTDLFSAAVRNFSF